MGGERNPGPASLAGLSWLARAGPGPVDAWRVAMGWSKWDGLLVVAPFAAAPTAGALIGRRWRLSDLGAGDELREHEMRRRWIWQPPPKRHHGERVYIR